MRQRLYAWRYDQRGEALPLALIALAVGALLMSPLLGHLATGFRATEKVAQTTRHQYASDAGIEYALWSLVNNSELRSAVLGSPGTAQELTLAGPVNDSTPVIRVVALETTEVEGPDAGAMLPYAIFGNNTSRTNTVVMSGSGHRVIGNVHSNNQIRITGSGHSVSGTVTYAGNISVVGAGHFFVPPPPGNPSPSAKREFPIAWRIEDFAPDGGVAEQAAAAGMYHVHTSRWNVSGAGAVIPPGLHYCLDDVNISGAGIIGANVTIVSRQTINVSGSGISFTPYVPGLTFYSAKESSTNVISISGSGNTGGTAYAPNGRISLTGSGGTIRGAFMGDRVDIAGSGATIQLAEIPLPGGGSELCGVYDIESIAGTTRTLVRATDCDAEGLRIISWHID